MGDAEISSMATAANANAKPVMTVKNLNFSYNPEKKKDLVNLNCIVPPNSKVILVGANGAGKSTLIRTLTGMIWGDDVKYDEFDINGKEKVNDQVNGVAYLGERWKRRRTGFEGVCPYTLDTAPTEMFTKWQADHVERRDELVKVLGVNLDWRLNECSDGQRKKVRPIMFKLLMFLSHNYLTITSSHGHVTGSTHVQTTQAVQIGNR